MRHSLSEILLGASVIIIAIIIAAYAIISNSDSGDSNYQLSANFGRIDGIFTGSDVRLGGVKIGSVTKTSLNKNTLNAELSLAIYDNIKLPENAEAAIASEGILGKNFIRIIIPNKADGDNYLADGGRIQKTADAIALEDLLGRALFIIGESGKD